MVLACLLLFATSAWASPSYSGCAQCHGGFNGRQVYESLHDGTAWPSNLMDAHVDWVDGNCLACHRQMGPGAVYLSNSGDEDYGNGCVGCHGREADVTGVCTDQASTSLAKRNCGAGAGLRQVHETKVGAGTCTQCHENDPQPAGEDTPPWNYLLAATTIRDACNGDGSEARIGATGLDNDGDGRRDQFDPDCRIQVNAGLNDAWADLNTDGQGFYLSVFPDVGVMALAWFTYDLERPPEDVTAQLGGPGQRWLSAAGGWEGNVATLTVEKVTGGRFDQSLPEVERDPDYGTITIEFHDCDNATLSYDIPELALTGTIEITRIVKDNVMVCEALSGM
jgi:hypothetical protein